MSLVRRPEQLYFLLVLHANEQAAFKRDTDCHDSPGFDQVRRTMAKLQIETSDVNIVESHVATHEVKAVKAHWRQTIDMTEEDQVNANNYSMTGS